jgi:hypothetical protein
MHAVAVVAVVAVDATRLAFLQSFIQIKGISF